MPNASDGGASRGSANSNGSRTVWPRAGAAPPVRRQSVVRLRTTSAVSTCHCSEVWSVRFRLRGGGGPVGSVGMGAQRGDGGGGRSRVSGGRAGRDGWGGRQGCAAQGEEGGGQGLHLYGAVQLDGHPLDVVVDREAVVEKQLSADRRPGYMQRVSQLQRERGLPERQCEGRHWGIKMSGESRSKAASRGRGKEKNESLAGGGSFCSLCAAPGGGRWWSGDNSPVVRTRHVTKVPRRTGVVRGAPDRL